MISTQLSLLPCFMVNNITNNSFEQCNFIIDNDCLEDDTTIDYVYLVYCELGHELRYLSMLLITSLVIVLFLALSVVADEFLCPCLLTVAKNLRMSDSLAGVTLLAFGNASPDIFSSLVAASDDRPELIVGELLGAGIFCTSVVSGLIFINCDFKIACRPILRDTTFYLLALYLIWSYCWNQEITFYGSLAFILIYVIYLLVALGGQAIHSRLQGNYAISQKQTENSESEEKYNNEYWYKWREESLRREKNPQSKNKSETSVLASSNSRVQYYGGITSVHFGSDSLESFTQAPLEVQLFNSFSQANPDGEYINKAFILNNERRDIKLDKIDNSKKQNNQQFANQQVIVLAKKPAITKCNDLTMNEWNEFLAHINPISSVNWCEASLTSKIIGIIRAPLLLVALITVPVVDYDRKYHNWCRLLNSLQCITVPLALILPTRFNLSLFGLPLSFFILVLGVMLGAFVLKKTNAQKPPKYHTVFAYFGFIMSVLWIYLIASEIIGLLKTVGIMFSMTDTAIGLGILAWGNSLGDIVANISLADAGYPRMAIGASIGAPLLNLLFGFGLAFTVSLKPDEFTIVKYSSTITLLCSTLAIILISHMLSTFISPKRSKKPFGYLLITSYGVYLALVICLEYRIINV